MSDINQDYYVLDCGSGKVPSPYSACARSHVEIYNDPTSFNSFALYESPENANDSIPLIEAMRAPMHPIFSNRIKECLDYFDLYKVQLLPVYYTHANNKQYDYWVMILDNKLNVYDFDNGDYFSRKSGDKVHAETIRIAENKLLATPFEKRLMFYVPGEMGKIIVHESVAKPLMALNATGLHLVPLLDWDVGFGMTI